MRRWLGPVAAVAVLALAGLGVGAASPAHADGPADPFGEFLPTVVVMDTSDSMDATIEGADGRTGLRIEAARAAVLDLLPTIGESQPFALVAYPSTGAPQEDGCSTGRVEIPLQTIDLAASAAAVRRLTSDGDTPTGPALEHAARLIEQSRGEGAPGLIVLVSDGESNCGPPPCDVAAELRDRGLDVQVNTVGLGLEPGSPGDEELRCIAEATGGTYYAAADADGLADGIGSAAQAGLAVAVTAPETFSVASGLSATDGGVISAEITSSGRVPAADVRVTLIVSYDDGGVGSVLVPRPVRFLGNMAIGSSITVDFAVRPDDLEVGDVTWTLAVTARNARQQILDGEARVTDGLGPSALGPLFDDVENVVVMGDSYSSGEGHSDRWEVGTTGRSGENACHRSGRTYADAIWGDDHVQTIACSGAVTSDFAASQTSNKQAVPAQLQQLSVTAASDVPPDAVLLTIGGNDIGFADLAIRCVVLPNCDRIKPQDQLDRTVAVQPSIAQVLRRIDDVVNAPAVVEARDGALAPVVILTYPRIVPDTARFGTSPSGCMVGISAPEVAYFNRVLDSLNSSVMLAAAQVHDEGRPVYAVAGVTDAFQPDHTVCEGAAKSYAVATDFAQALATFPAIKSDTGLLHPTDQGHEAMARAVIAWSQTRAATPIAPREVARGPVTWQAPVSLFERWLALVGTPHSIVSSRGVLVFQGTGFAPSSQVVFRVDSVPTVVGSAVADEDGNVDTAVRLPADLAAGAHHLRVFGMDEEGEPTEDVSDLTVLPVGGPALWWLTGAGVLLALIGTGLLLSARRARRASTPADPVASPHG